MGLAFKLVDIHLIILCRADEGQGQAFTVLPDVADGLQGEALYLRMQGDGAGKCFVELRDGVVADVDPADLGHRIFAVETCEHAV